MAVSVVIPFFNEAENVRSLLAEIRAAAPHAEIVAVDDASRDGTREALLSFGGIVVVTYPENLGQSAALWLGLQRASGDVIVMMDGDGQNDPADIPALLAELEKPGVDAAFGYRRRRKDTLSKRITSRLGNGIRRAALGDDLIDTGCSLKAIRREHVRFLTPFNGMHRYFGVFFARAGLNIAQVPVNHRPRLYGVSNYTNLGRAFRGARDLIGMSWLMSRRIRWPQPSAVVRHG